MRTIMYHEGKIAVPRAAIESGGLPILELDEEFPLPPDALCETQPFFHVSGDLRILRLANGPLPDKSWECLSARDVLLAAADTADKDEELELFLRAHHLAQWREDSRFCGRCGAPQLDAEDELARVCPACTRREYPRIAPAVIMLVEDGHGRVLLGHNARFRPGLYSLFAGFLEAGESLEQAVRRELREEASVEVDTIRYESSQPWPFPNAVMIGFRARYSSGRVVPDGKEIEDARWFDPNNLPELPGPGSIARSILERWVQEQNAQR